MTEHHPEFPPPLLTPPDRIDAARAIVAGGGITASTAVGSSSTDWSAFADDHLVWALRTAEAGFPVFRLIPGRKEPSGGCSRCRVAADDCRSWADCRHEGCHGLHGATTTLATVRRWWTESPRDGVGIAVPEAYVVIDIDPRHGGHIGWAALTMGREVPDTLTSVSGWRDPEWVDSGGDKGIPPGRHIWFRLPDGFRVAPGSFHAGAVDLGIDMKIKGGLVAAEPSMHASGQRYRWVDFAAPIAWAPGWLLELIELRADTAPAVREFVTAWRAQDNPFAKAGEIIAAYGRHVSHGDLLAAAGWAERGNGYWAHPAATHHVSAHVQIDRDGTTRMYCFSDSVRSTGIPDHLVTRGGDRHGISVFDLHALWHHDGDTNAALDAISKGSDR